MENDKGKIILRAICIFIAAMALLALCSRMNDSVKREPFQKVEGVFE